MGVRKFFSEGEGLEIGKEHGEKAMFPGRSAFDNYK